VEVGQIASHGSYRPAGNPGKKVLFDDPVVRIELEQSPKTTQGQKQSQKNASAGYRVYKRLGLRPSGSRHTPESHQSVDGKP
jgi:hypothetical protein